MIVWKRNSEAIRWYHTINSYTATMTLKHYVKSRNFAEENTAVVVENMYGAAEWDWIHKRLTCHKVNFGMIFDEIRDFLWGRAKEVLFCGFFAVIIPRYIQTEKRLYYIVGNYRKKCWFSTYYPKFRLRGIQETGNAGLDVNPAFCTRKAKKKPAFLQAFSSWWPDSNWRPHPYQTGLKFSF